MITRISRHDLRNSFKKKVERIANQNLMACYQCGKCSAGCPMATHMDIPPNQMIRLAQLGFGEELLNSKAIWMCVSCMTCNTRCPKGVKIAETIEAMRQIELRYRKEHLDVKQIPDETLGSIPPIALIGSMRKFTS